MVAIKTTPQRAVYPALASLGLDEIQFAALASQGTLNAEGPPGDKRTFKLRFRVGSKQCARYVGKCVGFVEQIRCELGELQRGSKSDRELRRLADQAKACLRQTCRDLDPVLHSVGYHLHGRQIRRRREDRKSFVRQQESSVNQTRRNIMEEPQALDAASNSPVRNVGGEPSQLPRFRRPESTNETATNVSLPVLKSPIEALPSIQNARRTSVDLFSKFSARLGDYLDTQPAGLGPMLRALPVVDVVGQWQRQSIRLFELETRLDEAPKRQRRSRNDADTEEQDLVT